MKTGYKYFIEHKDLGTWVTILGDLTNNPDELGLISFDERWLAEDHLKPVKPHVTSDYSGTRINIDYFGASLWAGIKNNIAEKNNGANIYTDFIITEHEFVQ